MKNLSLRLKLLSLVGMLSIVFLAVFGFTAYKSFSFLDADKETSTETFAESIVDKIDRNLFERYGDVQAFAMSEPARSGDPKRITAFMNDMIPTYAPIYSTMMVLSPKGKVIAVNSVNGEGKPLNTTALLGHDYSEESWFKKTFSGDIKPGTSHVEGPYLDSEVAAVLPGDAVVLTFTAPIRSRETGQILGVWTNRMSWKQVIEHLVTEEITAFVDENHPAIFPSIVNATGTYLLHPDGRAFESKTVDTDHGKKTAGLEHSAHAKTRTAEMNISKFKGPVIEATTLSKGYSSYPGLGWYVTVAVPKSDPHHSVLNSLITTSLFITLIALGVSLWLVRGINFRFAGVITSLETEAKSLSAASSELSLNSTKLAEAATEQASSLQETASSIEEISSMVNKSADSAQRSLQMASVSNETAGKGKKTIDEMIQSIQEISESNNNIMTQVEASNQRLTDIIKVISEIGNKTKVINDIVFQTKLLSFNASVEAARAGEHGKGFAVVAEEVGNLAQMSGNAAKEISTMLTESIRTVQTIVEETKGKVEGLIQDGKTKVESGITIAKQCGTVLEEIVKNETEISSMISEISTASHEQATGVSEINKAIGQLDMVTQQNSSIAQSAATHASGITKRAATVQDQVHILASIVHGGASKPVAVKSAQKTEKSSPKRVSVPSGPKTEAPKTEPTPDNVVPITKNQPKNASASDLGLKTALGDSELPKSDDSRFVEL